jgi:hypothetical protein
MKCVPKLAFWAFANNVTLGSTVSASRRKNGEGAGEGLA